MASRLTWTVYGVSLVAHAALGLGVAGVDAAPLERRRPVQITVEEIDLEEPEPPEPEPPPPKPKAPEPEEAKPLESKPPPAPKPAAKKAAPEPSASSDAAATGGDVFDGGEMSSSSTGTPVGGGGGGGDGDAAPVVREKKVAQAKTLGAKPAAAASGCAEKPGKPKPIEIPEPKYSDRARAAGIEGAVRVQVTVDAKGRVAKVAVLRPLDPDLDAAAKQAIEQARFEPALACGKPVESTFTISVKFTL